MKRSNRALIAVAIGAIVSVAAFAATGFAGSEDSDLELVAAPFPFIEESGAGFTIAKLDNSGPSTVTQGVLEIELTSSPVVTITQFDASCTPTTNAGSVLVSCPLPQVPAGGKESRLIRWTAPQVDQETKLTISSRLAYKNDPNNDTTAKDVITKILNGSDGPANAPGEVDVDSNCTSPSAPTGASTGQLPTALDPQTATLGYEAVSLGFPCNWAVTGETGLNPNARCGTGNTLCETGFWFASLPDALGSLTLKIYELPRSLSKFVLREFAGYPDDITTSTIVPLCVNGAPPATPPPFSCEIPNSREKLGSRGAIFHLLVKGTGRDPGYAG